MLASCLTAWPAYALRRPILGKTAKEISEHYEPVDSGKPVTLLDARGKERQMEWHVLAPGLGVVSSKMYWLEKSENRKMRVEFDSSPPRYMTVGFNRKGKACCAVPNFSRPAEFTRFLENQGLWRKCSQSHPLQEVFPGVKAREIRKITIPNLGRDENNRLILVHPHHVEKTEQERARITCHVRYTSMERAYAMYIEKEDTWERTYRQVYEPILRADAVRRGRRFFQETPKPPEIEECMVADADTFWAWTLSVLIDRFGSSLTAPKDLSRHEGTYLRDLSYEDAVLQQLGGAGIKPRLDAAITAALRNRNVTLDTLEHYILSAGRHENAGVITLLTSLVDRLPYKARDRGLWVLGIVKGASSAQAKAIPESVRQRITELQRRFDIDGDGKLATAEARNARSYLSK